MSKIKIILLAGIFCFGLPVLVQAYQIAPNPNLWDSTINVMTLDAENLTSFTNWGSLEIIKSGALHNASNLDSIGTIYNSGILLNDDTLYNLGNLHNNTGGFLGNNDLLRITGTGTLFNSGTMSNNAGGILSNEGSGTLSNDGTLHNDGNLYSSGDLGNNAGGSLNNHGFLRNSGTLSNVGILSNTGTLNNSGGILYNNSEGILYNSSGGIINNSEFLINGGILSNSSGGTLNNTDYLGNSGFLNNNGTLNNSGELFNTGTIAGTGTYIQTAGQTYNSGSFRQASIQIDGGCLGGTGTVTGNLSVGSGGCLGLGSSLGTMTVNGDVSSGGTLVFDVAGLASGQYDVLDISGNASFSGGTIQFNFIDSFSGKAGNYWDFLLANTITGWDNLGFSFNGLDAGLRWNFTKLDNGSKRLWLTSNSVSPIPEPEIYAMLLAGFSLIGFTARRRKDITIRNGGAWAHVAFSRHSEM